MIPPRAEYGVCVTVCEEGSTGSPPFDGGG
jgi:hypothetical protein